jgi:hypothetical protein
MLELPVVVVDYLVQLSNPLQEQMRQLDFKQLVVEVVITLEALQDLAESFIIITTILLLYLVQVLQQFPVFLMVMVGAVVTQVLLEDLVSKVVEEVGVDIIPLLMLLALVVLVGMDMFVLVGNKEILSWLL